MNQSQLTTNLSAAGYSQALKAKDYIVMTRPHLGEHCGQVIFNDGEIKTLRTVDAVRAFNNEDINMSIYTKKQLEGMKEKELTTVYNYVTGKNVKRATPKAKVVTKILAEQKEPAKVSQKADPQKKERRAGACAVVHQTANGMPDATRAEVIAACVKQGINKSTAATQYQKWRKANANN